MVLTATWSTAPIVHGSASSITSNSMNVFTTQSVQVEEEANNQWDDANSQWDEQGQEQGQEEKQNQKEEQENANQWDIDVSIDWSEKKDEKHAKKRTGFENIFEMIRKRNAVLRKKEHSVADVYTVSWIWREHTGSAKDELRKVLAQYEAWKKRAEERDQKSE